MVKLAFFLKKKIKNVEQRARHVAGLFSWTQLPESHSLCPEAARKKLEVGTGTTISPPPPQPCQVLFLALRQNILHGAQLAAWHCCVCTLTQQEPDLGSPRSADGPRGHAARRPL